MAKPLQNVGLAALLDWGDGGARDQLIFAALATTAAASPLAAISYRAKGISALGRAATAVAAPVTLYALQPTSFTASALAPAVIAQDDDAIVPTKAHPTPWDILALYHPWNICKVVFKGVAVAILVRLNPYIMASIDHETKAIAAESQGHEPPPPPQFPDLWPAVHKGLATAMREQAIATTRRVYEVIVVRRMPAPRAQALLRDSKAWIRDVLSVKYRNAPAGRRLFAYYFATLHSSALFYAADCTVSVVQHSYRTLQRRDEPKRAIQYWAKGVVLQIGRCTLILAAASAGAALGSLIKPGTGTYWAQAITEAGTAIALGQLVAAALE